ncbi:hypothetical protein ACFLR3_01665 [Campylobacterota bacterium]
MNSRKWLLNFLIITMTLFILIEFKYQIHPSSRHEVDYLVNEYIPTLKNADYETVVLGDSLAHKAFSSLIIKNNILDLTSNQAISMAGNYFLLKRYFKNNNLPKSIYLFIIPGFLHNNLNQIYTYSYFESVFTSEDEMREIKLLKPNLYNNYFNINKFLERRAKAMHFDGYKPGRKSQYVTIDEKDLIKRSSYMNEKIKNKIIWMKKRQYLIENIPRIYLDKIIKICQDNNIKFTLVIEPIAEEYNILYKTSKWNEYLIKKRINYININDYYIFNTYFFKDDGTHITGNVNQYYQNLIDKHILDIY